MTKMKRIRSVAALVLFAAVASGQAETQLPGDGVSASPNRAVETAPSGQGRFEAELDQLLRGAATGSPMPASSDDGDTRLHNELYAQRDDRVCCKRGHRDWFATRRECRRADGYIVSRRECRDDRGEQVCCKRGHRDWFTTRRECRRADGYIVRDRECRDDRGEQVCCKRGHRDWFTTRRECRRADGYVVSRRECRR